jgi:ABC-type antimicrobial peptide transport system permease subunit
VIGYTLQSLRRQPGRVAASFISLALGATIVMAFASLLDTAGGDGLSATERETLVTMAVVVGGWGLIIVVFAVASTLTLAVRQRSQEMALLKSVGATPGQVGRMIVGEAVVVAAVAAAVAVLPALAAGRGVLALLRDSDQVRTFGAAAVAALVTARRTARLRARDALTEAALPSPRLSRKRKVAAGVFLALGVGTGVLTATLMRGEGIDAMQTGGQASIWFAIGLALLAPALLRVTLAVVERPLRALGGACGYLAVQNVRQRGPQMARAVMPIVLFTAIATGTLVMQGIENGATAATGSYTPAEARSLETLNVVVVGMIAVFAAIMLVNTLVAATAERRRELGQQRLAGATPPEVLRTVRLEAAVLVATGVLFGSLASLVTIVPYSLARTDSVVPTTGAGTYLAVVATAVALTLASTLGTARRVLRARAVEAVAAA